MATKTKQTPNTYKYLIGQDLFAVPIRSIEREEEKTLEIFFQGSHRKSGAVLQLYGFHIFVLAHLFLFGSA